MKITYLKDHLFLNQVSAITRQYFAKCNPDEPKNDPPANPKERYGIEVLVGIGNIISCLDQLYFSIDMLPGYNKKNLPEKMNRYDYVVYGVENYYLRFTSVYDRCLRLVNIVFRLGLPERQCKNDTIIKNTHIQNKSIFKSLTKLDKFTSNFRFLRNTISHNKTYSEKCLDEIGSYYYLLEVEDDIAKRFHKYLNLEMNKNVINKKEQFKEHLVKLETLVEIFFDSLIEPFNLILKNQS
ncbi:MAG: Cthe_2314 family HEPN domain-containing protein [Candidatus Muiribacteriota bacterium]